MERLRILQKHGLLRARRLYIGRETFFLASGMTQELLQGLNPNRIIQEPTYEIDLRSFEHDRRVSWCRAVREKSASVSNWRSERRLKQEFAYRSCNYKISRDFLPDAIYTNQLGGQVAFELELSPKTKERYSKKISTLVEVMRSPNSLFTRTFYIACSKPIQDTLAELTRPYGELFRVQLFSELVSSNLFPGGKS